MGFLGFNMNNLSELNEILFNQLKKLSNEDISKDDLSVEVIRARAITDMSKTIIDNARLALDVEKARGDTVNANSLPLMIKLR